MEKSNPKIRIKIVEIFTILGINLAFSSRNRPKIPDHVLICINETFKKRLRGDLTESSQNPNSVSEIAQPVGNSVMIPFYFNCNILEFLIGLVILGLIIQ